eukprot:3934913-Rhodomonas_salina.1
MQRQQSAPRARSFAAHPIDYSQPSEPAPCARPFGSILCSSSHSAAPSPAPPTRQKSLSRALSCSDTVAREPEPEPERTHNLVTEGLMGNGPDGEQLVDEALRQGEEEWNSQQDCSCTCFKFSPTMYDGKLLMVCTGVSAKYLNKGLPKSETIEQPATKKCKSQQFVNLVVQTESRIAVKEESEVGASVKEESYVEASVKEESEAEASVKEESE